MTDQPQTTNDVFAGMSHVPREASAYRKGVAARRHGTRLDANPFHRATSIQAANFRQWREGWQAADKEASHGK